MTSRGNVGRYVSPRLMGNPYPRCSIATGVARVPAGHMAEMPTLPPQVAGFDSASAMVVAVARFLDGQDPPPLGKPALRALRPVVAAAARLPVGAREWIYSVFSGAEGRPASDIAAVDIDA